MALITIWEKDLKTKNVIELCDIQSALTRLQKWELFSQAYPEMKQLNSLLHKTIDEKRRNQSNG